MTAIISLIPRRRLRGEPAPLPPLRIARVRGAIAACAASIALAGCWGSSVAGTAVSAKRLDPAAATALRATRAVRDFAVTVRNDGAGASANDPVAAWLRTSKLARTSRPGHVVLSDVAFAHAWRVADGAAHVAIGSATAATLREYDTNVPSPGIGSPRSWLIYDIRIEFAPWARALGRSSLLEPELLDDTAVPLFDRDLRLQVPVADLRGRLQAELIALGDASPVAGVGEFDDALTHSCPASIAIAAARLRWRRAVFASAVGDSPAGSPGAVAAGEILARGFARCAAASADAHRRAWARLWAADAAHQAALYLSASRVTADARRLGDGQNRVLTTLDRVRLGRFADAARFAGWVLASERTEDPVALVP